MLTTFCFEKFVYLCPRSFIFRAFHFCKACHEDVRDETQIKKCKCKSCKFGNQKSLEILPNSALIPSIFSGRNEDNLDSQCIQAK